MRLLQFFSILVFFFVLFLIQYFSISSWSSSSTPSPYYFVYCFSRYLVLRTSHSTALQSESRLLYRLSSLCNIQRLHMHQFRSLSMFATADIPLRIFISTTSNFLVSQSFWLAEIPFHTLHLAVLLLCVPCIQVKRGLFSHWCCTSYLSPHIPTVLDTVRNFNV